MYYHNAMGKLNMRNLTLLNPGPVNVSEKVRQALLIPDICHREAEFSQLQEQVRKKILQVLNLSSRYSVALLTGSGTAALEAAVLAACNADSAKNHSRSGNSLLVLSNGVYAERIADIAQRHRIPTRVLRFAYNQRIDEEQVGKILKKDHSIRTVAMTHHETSTGMLNLVDGVGHLAQRYGKIFAIDAISSLGADDLEIEKAGVDFCIGTAGKCFHALPGVSFVLAKRSLLSQLTRKEVSSLYFDLGNIWKHQEKGDTPFTPAVQLFSAFNIALDEFLSETLQGRIISYQSRSSLLRDEFEELGLQFLLPRSYYSNTLTSLKLSQGLSYENLHDPLKEEGFVIYAGQNRLRRQIFRVAHMGNIPDEELKRFMEVLGKILSPVSLYP